MEKSRKPGAKLAVLIALSACAAQGGTNLPSGIIPPACQSLVGHSNLILPCYLNDQSNVNIGLAIVWNFPKQTPSTVYWYQWPATAKAQLNDAFVHIVDWHNNGMVNYGGTLVPDPPPNSSQADYIQGLTGFPSISSNDAWNIYIQYVALTLAAEIYQWVPWGLHTYDTNEEAMQALLNAIRVFTWDTTGTVYYMDTIAATPGNAIDVYKFLVTNNLIGTTRVDP